MRIEWELAGFQIERGRIGQAFGFIAAKFRMDWTLSFSEENPRMVVMVSKLDHCLYDLLLKKRSGEIRCEIPLILSNHPDCKPIADSFGIPFRVIAVGQENREEAEQEQIREIRKAEADFVVLARYMQVLSGSFVDAFQNRIINIHHSFLPAFVGAKPYHQAYHRGVKIIGATSHFVTGELDNGPIIDQDVTRISHRDSLPDLVQKGKELEKLVLSRAVKLFVEHKVLVSENKTVIFD
jgi:formyltetrahydrofolate deformylase